MGLFDRNPNESAYEWLTSKTAVDFFGGSSLFETYVKSFTLLSPFRPVIWVLFLQSMQNNAFKTLSGENISIIETYVKQDTFKLLPD